MPYRETQLAARHRGRRRRVLPIRPNVVWALDFQFDQTSDGRMLKLLNVIDEFSRESLAIDIGRSIDAERGGRLSRAPGRRTSRPGLRAL